MKIRILIVIIVLVLSIFLFGCTQTVSEQELEEFMVHQPKNNAPDINDFMKELEEENVTTVEEIEQKSEELVEEKPLIEEGAEMTVEEYAVFANQTIEALFSHVDEYDVLLTEIDENYVGDWIDENEAHALNVRLKRANDKFKATANKVDEVQPPEEYVQFHEALENTTKEFAMLVDFKIEEDGMFEYEMIHTSMSDEELDARTSKVLMDYMFLLIDYYDYFGEDNSTISWLVKTGIGG